MSSSSSRNPSLSHAPTTPSGLRESHTIARSPEEFFSPIPEHTAEAENAPSSSETSPRSRPTPSHIGDENENEEEAFNLDSPPQRSGTGDSIGRKVADETTALLRKPFEFVTAHPHEGECNHGTFSPGIETPGPLSRTGSFRSGYGFGGPLRRTGSGGSSSPRGVFGNLMEGMGMNGGGENGKKKQSTTSYLAERHGIKNTRSMYLPYYIPLFAWIRQYKWAYLKGDLIAAITMASFYLPMGLSLADNLSHVPPINGLYSFVFNPLIYAILGSCPQMVVGPEAAGSLLVGNVVRSSIDAGRTPEWEAEMHARVAGVVTGMAGATIFIAGICRLGFLDSVFSRPFLRGFISAVGFVIFVDQLIPELGLVELASKAGVSHGSSVDKIKFLFQNAHKGSGITAAVAGVSFLISMVAREIKRRLQPRYPAVAYFPDRFLIVVFSAILAWQLEWDKKGLELLGKVEPTSGVIFQFHWPFQISHMKHIREAMGTSFVIALLGFFESSVAAKSLGGGEKDGLEGISLSANRELIALGGANLVGSCFCALPAFGGYGRSKVNKNTGGKTPMSSIFLSLMAIFSILFLLPAFAYLPKAILSSMISVVAWSLLEEIPPDFMFFVKIRGYTELGLMMIIFASTIFYDLNMGIAIGVGLSLLSVLRHSTRPRIQILGRIPGTNRFENAEDRDNENGEGLEFVEGCLIVKIPEPLTFANTGDLKNRLRRLELYGTTSAHPALPRVRAPEHNKNIIFDIHGVTSLDGSGTQVLEEIVRGYRERGVRVFFSRAPSEGSRVMELMRRSGIMELVGGRAHFVGDVGEALRLTETEEMGEEYVNESGDEGGG